MALKDTSKVNFTECGNGLKKAMTATQSSGQLTGGINGTAEPDGGAASGREPLDLVQDNTVGCVSQNRGSVNIY